MNEELFCKIHSSITGEKITSLEDLEEPISIPSREKFYMVCELFYHRGELRALRDVNKYLNK